MNCGKMEWSPCLQTLVRAIGDSPGVIYDFMAPGPESSSWFQRKGKKPRASQGKARGSTLGGPITKAAILFPLSQNQVKMLTLLLVPSHLIPRDLDQQEWGGLFQVWFQHKFMTCPQPELQCKASVFSTVTGQRQKTTAEHFLSPSGKCLEPWPGSIIYLPFIHQKVERFATVIVINL